MITEHALLMANPPFTKRWIVQWDSMGWGVGWAVETQAICMERTVSVSALRSFTSWNWLALQLIGEKLTAIELDAVCIINFTIWLDSNKCLSCLPFTTVESTYSQCITSFTTFIGGIKHSKWGSIPFSLICVNIRAWTWLGIHSLAVTQTGIKFSPSPLALISLPHNVSIRATWYQGNAA